MTLADRLQRLLTAKGYSIAAAAQDAGMERQQVWMIVTGKNANPKWLTVERIVEAAGGEMRELFVEGDDD